MSATTAPLILTKQLGEKYLASLMRGGRKAETIHVYRRCMDELYEFLPEGKEISQGTLEDWKAYLKDCGYSDSTVNLRMTAANGLLKFCGMKEYAAPHERIEAERNPPKLTRTEYLRFLSAVREMGTEQEYLLIKLFASIDIGINELQHLTVEACREGVILMPDGRKSLVPPSLAQEMLDYAGRRGIESGAVFVTRSGNPLDRSNIARAIRQLAHEAGMDPEKCCPRALHRMYQTTQEELKEKILPIYLQTYDNLLNTERAVVAWGG